MGIILKQTIKGSFYTYFGVAIGFVTTLYLFPEYLTTDTIGLFGVLLAYTGLFAQIFSIGINGVTARMFPHFRNNEKGHHGYLFIAFMVLFSGFLLFLVVFFMMHRYLVKSNLEDSKLFADYAYLVIPLTFCALFFNMLDTYNKLLYNAVLGLVLKEFAQRVFILIFMILYILGWINLVQLIFAYAASVCLKSLIIFIYLLSIKQIKLKPDFGFLNKKLIREMFSVALISILASLGSTIVFSIDKIIINQMLDLSKTGIYTIGFYFGTLVIIPSRPLLKIAGTIIAEAWKKNDLKKIKEIYYKSCINLFIVGGLLFMGIWINIDNILIILGDDYTEAKWVIFFIGLSYLFDMMTGANGFVISYSKYYRVDLIFISILIGFVILNNMLLIPVWGITGAAIAIAFSIFLNNLMRYIFLFKKYKLQPFNRKFLFVLAFLVTGYFTTELIPNMNLIPDILTRSISFTLLYGILIYFSKVSADINNFVDLVINRISNFFR